MTVQITESDHQLRNEELNHCLTKFAKQVQVHEEVSSSHKIHDKYDSVFRLEHVVHVYKEGISRLHKVYFK